MILRQGRKNKYNLYLQLGDEPSDNDVSLGYVRYPQWGKAICDAVNGTTGGVVPGTVEADWQRAEELRVTRLGPGQDDIPEMNDKERPGASLHPNS